MRRGQVNAKSTFPDSCLPGVDATDLPDSLLEFKRRNQLGRFAPTHGENTSDARNTSEDLPPGLEPGSRCEVSLSEEMSRRGTVRFVGPADFGPQDGRIWVGVEWDEPVGKNDGMQVAAFSSTITTATVCANCARKSYRVDGKRYFQTGPLRASFVKPSSITVGDFPELDPFAEDDDMEM